MKTRNVEEEIQDKVFIVRSRRKNNNEESLKAIFTLDIEEKEWYHRPVSGAVLYLSEIEELLKLSKKLNKV